MDNESPDRPVVRVDLRYYDRGDGAVAKFTKLLQAFPKLAELQFKSAKITDAGLVHLKSLTKVRSLSLENTSITDAGLVQLRAMNDLEKVDLKGTGITDAGIRDFQAAMPRVKIGR